MAMICAGVSPIASHSRKDSDRGSTRATIRSANSANAASERLPVATKLHPDMSCLE